MLFGFNNVPVIQEEMWLDKLIALFFLLSKAFAINKRQNGRDFLAVYPVYSIKVIALTQFLLGQNSAESRAQKWNVHGLRAKTGPPNFPYMELECCTKSWVLIINF